MSSTITVCRGPKQPHWGLGATTVSHGVLDMLGWRIEPAPEDAGMPPGIAELFATACTRIAQVTFRSSRVSSSAPSEGDNSILNFPGGLLDRLRGHRQTQVSTRRATTAALLFDDPEYPWWLGAQAALLSPFDSPAPSLTAQDWDALLTAEWTAAAARIAEASALAVLRAGVDGDVAGIWSRDRAFADMLLDAARNAAEAAGFAWAEVPEAAF